MQNILLGISIIVILLHSVAIALNLVLGFLGLYQKLSRYIRRNIHIISYGGTKIGQPEWGNMFSKIIYDLESFEINEHQLRFYYDDSEKSVTLSHE